MKLNEIKGLHYQDSKKLKRELILSIVIGWPIAIALIWIVLNLRDMLVAL